MHLHFIENGPALLIEQDQRVLVVADLHMGIESGLERHGVHIASRSAARADRVIACIEEAKPDLLLLLGDIKHNVPVTSRQEYRELPGVLERFRDRVPIAVAPGNHDGGIGQFLDPGELLPSGGALIDGVGYLHGHTHPAPELPGHLIVLGHHHPVVSLVDSVGCAARARPAYLYSGFEGPCLDRTRLLFVPAFNEFAGGIDVGRLHKSGLGPLSRCIDMKFAEVFLADGTYVGSPATLCPAGNG
ncbi:MAG: Putative phosphoesterase [Methanoculleus marisnigri]|jgi:Predicted ICC-like phosphoesterases|uniref:Putative phosphoesterase n=1 Tax=Methanoculleus marisnigri TaxID=2198 RepID=A0A101IUC8_9EURY|nr:metallophosphoesterase [Methanoculleus marisnigri]KUK61011.1 MAG: Putative phosphoesterase [Methanoculleus marisnigri]KUL01206.1 MAG: Putative phosphoesterase [Methanoculleus marisnigri]